jgi:voltage-gated sodium channel
MADTAARAVDSLPFTAFIFAVIVANAVVLGLETYDRLERQHGGTLNTLNDVFLAIFVVELVVRMAAYGRRPQEFFRSGWNAFDFLIIGASFVPGLGTNTTLLRLVRLLRVVRIVSLLPDLRVLLLAVYRSIPPVLSVAVLAVLVVYIYGMVGWLLFGDELPGDWGNIGRAMLTLFVLLTLENLPNYLEEAMDVHSWSWIYFVTFALAASFLLLNVLIGIIINSMEEARAIEHNRERAERRARMAEAEAAADEEERAEMLARRVTALREALEELEDELVAGERLPARGARARHGHLG